MQGRDGAVAAQPRVARHTSYHILEQDMERLRCAPHHGCKTWLERVK